MLEVWPLIWQPHNMQTKPCTFIRFVQFTSDDVYCVGFPLNHASCSCDSSGLSLSQDALALGPLIFLTWRTTHLATFWCGLSIGITTISSSALATYTAYAYHATARSTTHAMTRPIQLSASQRVRTTCSMSLETSSASSDACLAACAVSSASSALACFAAASSAAAVAAARFFEACWADSAACAAAAFSPSLAKTDFRACFWMIWAALACSAAALWVRRDGERGRERARCARR